MKAFVVEHYGRDGLRVADVPEPEVGAGDVLVKVSAAGVNPLDRMVRNGEFKRLLKYRTPFVLGHDVAGVVTRVGAAVRDLRVGDEVYGRPRDLRIGTFAEYIAIDRDDVAPKPASLTLHEAAAVPLVSLAAWQALVDRAHAQPGQKVLVHAGAGGLGSTVIQLAKHLGTPGRRPPAATTPSWCATSAPTSSWTTPRRTSPGERLPTPRRVWTWQSRVSDCGAAVPQLALRSALISQRSTEARVPGVSAGSIASRGPSAAAISSAVSNSWITTAVRWSGSWRIWIPLAGMSPGGPSRASVSAKRPAR